MLSDRKTIGGRRRLTNAAINEMQTYYGLSIRRNMTSPLEMKKRSFGLSFFIFLLTIQDPCMNYVRKARKVVLNTKKPEEKNENYDHVNNAHFPHVVMEENKYIFRDSSNLELL